MKEDVLADLPPKIIQDYYCELSSLQKRLYEDFAKQQVHEVKDNVESKDGKQHIFKALQYMRKLCNHPGLVLQPKHPKYEEITLELKQEGSNIWDVKNAPKLAALTELLIDCGITGGMLADKSEVEVLTSGSGVVSQHRALIFCQVREMLDRIEKDVLKVKLPGVTYLRLDGNVDAKDRFGIVEKFNADPTIDLLLLTTHVGGLGLNLTGADTVIFVEHDWNPMKDLQAMDRAHRLGQKRVVNVYRLITKNTLEEKIMG
jgi:TATA-binding protein-associated factor